MDLKRKAAMLLLQNLMQTSKKRRGAEDEEFEEFFSEISEDIPDDDDNGDGDFLGPLNYAIALSTTSNNRGGHVKKQLTEPIKEGCGP